MQKTLIEPAVQSLKLESKGKVRNIYGIDDEYMLIVTTDRISAFDVVLPDPIAYKGAVLTAVTNFWFDKIADGIPSQATHIPLTSVLTQEEASQLDGRAVIVKRLKPLPVEAIVRGYLVGSGWKDYRKTGKVCGIQLPEGLELASKLEEPIFTPSTKADVGGHDENISLEDMSELIGFEMAEIVKMMSIDLYIDAHNYAAERGIIIADTKLEFGLDKDGVLHLIDEVLTPDSSRFWPVDQYQVGKNPPSYDKQYVRDYLETLDWDKTTPGPELPEEVINNTTRKYLQALKALTGKGLGVAA